MLIWCFFLRHTPEHTPSHALQRSNVPAPAPAQVAQVAPVPKDEAPVVEDEKQPSGSGGGGFEFTDLAAITGFKKKNKNKPNTGGGIFGSGHDSYTQLAGGDDSDDNEIR